MLITNTQLFITITSTHLFIIITSTHSYTFVVELALRHTVAYIWYYLFSKKIKKLEKIQRRATKLIPGLRDPRYEERFK